MLELVGEEEFEADLVAGKDGACEGKGAVVWGATQHAGDVSFVFDCQGYIGIMGVSSVPVYHEAGKDVWPNLIIGIKIKVEECGIAPVAHYVGLGNLRVFRGVERISFQCIYAIESGMRSCVKLKFGHIYFKSSFK